MAALCLGLDSRFLSFERDIWCVRFGLLLVMTGSNFTVLEMVHVLYKEEVVLLIPNTKEKQTVIISLICSTTIVNKLTWDTVTSEHA